MDTINKKDAALYVDSHCGKCSKRAALSNLKELDGRLLCDSCYNHVTNPEGTNKSPEMEAFLNKLTKATFGRERTGDVCVTCGSTKVKPEDFRDDLSRKEFRISKMCQVCQDSVFGVPYED